MSVIRFVVIAFVLAFALPAPVQAQDYVVNDETSDGDTNAGDGACMTLAGKCSLLAAIQEGNQKTGPHMITFDPMKAKKINLTAGLPQITAKVMIDGTNAMVVGGASTSTAAASIVSP